MLAAIPEISLESDRRVLRRKRIREAVVMAGIVGFALVGGAANWWFDVGGIRFDDPALMQRIGGLTTSASETLQLDRRVCT